MLYVRFTRLFTVEYRIRINKVRGIVKYYEPLYLDASLWFLQCFLFCLLSILEIFFQRLEMGKCVMERMWCRLMFEVHEM